MAVANCPPQLRLDDKVIEPEDYILPVSYDGGRSPSSRPIKSERSRCSGYCRRVRARAPADRKPHFRVSSVLSFARLFQMEITAVEGRGGCGGACLDGISAFGCSKRKEPFRVSSSLPSLRACTCKLGSLMLLTESRRQIPRGLFGSNSPTSSRKVYRILLALPR